MDYEDVKLGATVQFEFLGKIILGRLLSVEHGVANVKSFEQGKYGRAAYHPKLSEIEYAQYKQNNYMTKQEKLEAIRGVCVKANDEIIVEGDIIYRLGKEDRDCLHLADILLAITPHLTNSDYDNDKDRKIIDLWNLRNDDLTDQSEQTITFLYDLLVPNK